MLDSFDPKEKKAILIFIALLLLGVVYLSTHRVNWGILEPIRQLEGEGRMLLPDEEESAAGSGRYL